MAPVLLLLAALSSAQSASLLDAAQQGDLATVRSRLAEGADVDVGNRYGATALFFAAERGHLEIVRLLIDHGARVDIEDSFYQMTALSRALFKGHFDVVRLLLEHGAPGADTVLAHAAGLDDLALAESALETDGLTGEGYDQALERAGSESSTRVAALIRSHARPTRRPEPEPAPSGELPTSVLTGRYQNDARNEQLTVAADGDSLTLEGARRGRLMPLGGRRFSLEGSDVEVAFGGRGGMVERMVLETPDESISFRPIDEAESREAAPVAAADVISPVAAPAARRGAGKPWPGFRGPNGSGIADGQGIALEWSEAEGRNIRFKTPIPGFSVASPIVWENRVYIVTAVSGSGNDTFRTGLYGDVAPVEDVSEHRWLLIGLDGADGSILWERELHRGVPGTKRHTKSSQANATPVTDGRYVVTVLGATGTIYCHDVAGELVWKKEIGVRNVGWFYDPDYQWGHSSSPILYDGSVIVQSDAHNGSFIASFRIEDGEEVWRTERSDEIPTFSTPAVFRGRERDELITNGTLVRGYDPKTGELLWHLGPNSEIPIGVPVVTQELIYVTAGYPPIRPIYAIRPGSRGDLALPSGVERSEALAWSKNRGGTYIPSPLVYDGYFYTNANNGRLTVYDAQTGERVYRARIGGVGGSYAASPIVADGKIYFTNEEGETFVVRAGARYELLAKNSIDGTVLSTPAASDGLLVIRSLSHVYGISPSE